MIRRLARRGWRQLSLLCAILLVFCLLADRLYTLQVGVRAQDRLQLEKWYTADVAAPQVEKPPRGTIVDVNGSSLVSTVTVYKLAAAPALVLKSAKAPVVARLLTDVLFPVRLPGGQYAHDPKRIQKALDAYTAHYEDFLAALKSSWNYVCLAGDESYTCPYKSNLTQGLLNTLLGRLAKLGVAGISEEPRSLPSYPNGRLASQVLGYVDYQYPGPVDTGQYGVQQYYNNLLAGTPGHTTVRFDTKGNPIRVGTGNDAAPQAGATLRLTLDSYVQYLVEQDLTRVVKAQHATGGSIVVERPGDGAIVAMASTPSYDPNTWRALVALKAKQAGAGGKKYNQTAFMQSLYQLFPNPAVSKRYEPGSTFKAFTIATGFDAGLFNENTRVNGPSSLPVDGITITNWCGTQCTFFGPETPSVMLHYSSNIGAAQFSRIIPPTTWYQYIMNNFDFSRPAGIDLAGEVGGDIRWPNDKPPKLVWVPAYKDTQAYGQGLSITPLQLTNGYAALANGGMLPTPHLLASYTLAGKTVTPAWPPIQRAISSQTSERMRKLLVSQAIGGEACKALVPGYDIAAKTGTASIPAAGGNYYPNTTIASTVAFGPVDAPIGQQYVVLVKVDKPAVQWGSEVAAPVVNDIFQHLFQYYKIMPAANPVQPKNGICHEVNSSQLDPWPPKP
jgi:cell division protein FtsI/penicillin-binding protein 2